MKRRIAAIQGASIWEDDGRVFFTADADIDADGANGQGGGKPAYTPKNDGLDDVRNARTNSGLWVGILADKYNVPILQGPKDPSPGAYISTTTLRLLDRDGKAFPKTNPRRYVDSDSVPFIVIPPIIAKATKGIVLGCKAKVFNRKTGMACEAVVADTGPTFKIGEISIEAARRLGVNPNARTGGESRFVIEYELFPGVPAKVDGVTYPLQTFGK